MVKKLKNLSQSFGFTLIEVLLALAILTIGLSGLLRSNLHNIQFTTRLKDKFVAHQIAMSTMADIQTRVIDLPVNQEASHIAHFLGETGYWHAKVSPTPIHALQQVTVSVSHHQTGPTINQVIGYRYAP